MTVTRQMLALSACSAAAWALVIVPAWASPGPDHREAVCHPVEGNGPTGTGWVLIGPDKASSHLADDGTGKHVTTDGRTDVLAVDGLCPGQPAPDPTTTAPAPSVEAPETSPSGPSAPATGTTPPPVVPTGEVVEPSPVPATTPVTPSIPATSSDGEVTPTAAPDSAPVGGPTGEAVAGPLPPAAAPRSTSAPVVRGAVVPGGAVKVTRPVELAHTGADWRVAAAALGLIGTGAGMVRAARKEH